MNSNFSDKQIEAYAAAFREGDAIWCGGEWYEVVKNKENGDNRLTAYVDGNIFIINDNRYGGRQSGTPYGFWVSGRNKNPYRVTTLEDYELQGGEKLVWLGGELTMAYTTFGKTYKAISDHRGKVYYRDDKDNLCEAGNKGWAVIPRYEQVKHSDDQAKKEPKFNVGDKVLVNKFISGTIVEVLGNDKYLVSIVYRSGMEERNEFNGFQLELAKEEPPAPRVITFNEEEINEELNSDVTGFDMDLHHVLSDLESTLKSKNKDYGDSFKQSYDEFGMTAVNIRLTDKFNRFKQLAKGAEPQVDESLKDTIKDIAGYMILTLIELNREDDNDE